MPKQRGVKNRKTLMWENLGEYFTKYGAERAMNIMKKSSDREFMQYYIHLIELFKPKLQRVDNQISIQDNTLQVNRRIITGPIIDQPKTIDIEAEETEESSPTDQPIGT